MILHKSLNILIDQEDSFDLLIQKVIKQSNSPVI